MVFFSGGKNNKLMFFVVFMLIIGMYLAMEPVHSSAVPTFEEAFRYIGNTYLGEKNGLLYSKLSISHLMDILSDPFKTNNLRDLAIYFLPAFLLTYLLVYLVLEEMGIFGNKNLLMSLSAVISLIALVGGVVSYVAFVVSNFIALGILALFLGLVYLGMGKIYKKKIEDWGYNVIGHHLFYVFVTHIPLIFAFIVTISTVWMVVFGSLPWTGKEGILIGAGVGALLLSLKFD